MDVTLPAELNAAFAVHGEVMYLESLQARAWEFDNTQDRLSPALVERLRFAASLSRGSLQRARKTIASARRAAADVFGTLDAIVTPSAQGEAPEGLAYTGDPAFNQLWTALHAPCVSIPAGSGPNDLPIGLQVVAAAGRDREALAWAE